MAIYRFKVSFTDNPEIYRLIDIKPEDNLEKFHKVILKSVKFEEGELAAFYLYYKDKKKQVEIGLTELDSEESSSAIMKNVKIKDYVSKINDKLTYIYDFLNMWTFDIELQKKIEKPTAGTKYPAIIKSVGTAPSQFESPNEIYSENLSEEDLLIISDMMTINKNFSKDNTRDDNLGMMDEEFLGLNDEDDDFREDSFGGNYGGYDDDDF